MNNTNVVKGALPYTVNALKVTLNALYIGDVQQMDIGANISVHKDV